MNELSNSVEILGRPYSITRSRLGAITKVYGDRYLCDINGLKELFQSIGEKLTTLKPIGNPAFSLLISFSDQTHHDGVTTDLHKLGIIPTGKQTERVVMKWVVKHELEGLENELSVTVRISNPINPLLFLQAALSKSASDIDNVDFELGSTCVTVDGSGQAYADEVFLRVSNWLEARNKPHPYLDVGRWYLRFEWWLDQLSESILPLLAIAAFSLWSGHSASAKLQSTLTPILLALFCVLRSIGGKLNLKMASWAKRSSHISVFAITSGDGDAITKSAAAAKNSFLKLVGSGLVAFVLNVAAGIVCWWLLEP